MLVDGGLLQSKSTAIQIGDEMHAQMSTLVFQNITIQRSHRSAHMLQLTAVASSVFIPHLVAAVFAFHARAFARSQEDTRRELWILLHFVAND